MVDRKKTKGKLPEKIEWTHCKECGLCHPTAIPYPFHIHGMGGGKSKSRIKNFAQSPLGMLTIGIMAAFVGLGINLAMQVKARADAGTPMTREELRQLFKEGIQEEGIETVTEAAADAVTKNSEESGTNPNDSEAGGTELAQNTGEMAENVTDQPEDAGDQVDDIEGADPQNDPQTAQNDPQTTATGPGKLPKSVVGNFRQSYPSLTQAETPLRQDLGPPTSIPRDSPISASFYQQENERIASFGRQLQQAQLMAGLERDLDSETPTSPPAASPSTIE